MKETVLLANNELALFLPVWFLNSSISIDVLKGNLTVVSITIC